MDTLLIQQFNLFNNTKITNYILENKIMIYCNIDLIHNYDNNNKIKTWIYNKNNYRIPKDIRYYKLKENDNIYDYISSSSLININEVISGERLQGLADIVLGVPSSLNWNPNNKFYSKKMGNLENITDISPYNIIFIFTHDLDLFYKKFKNNLENKILISHNSDHEISEIMNVKKHFAQNCLIKNLNTLPIGIENTQFFDYNLLDQVMRMKIKKTKDVYFYFSLSTHPSRKTCFDLLKNKLEWNTKRNKTDYFIELAKHKYCICPRGNGLDTHRLYECLYLNVIPIMIKDDFINIDGLPIIVIDDWSSFDKNDLLDEFNNQELSKITMSHWRKIIQ